MQPISHRRPRTAHPALASSILFTALSLSSCAEIPKRLQPRQPLQYGVEVQAYPAGVIPGLHVRRPVGERNVVITRLAANLTERNDWGEHDDESGTGFGGGIGWRRFTGPIPEEPVSPRPSAALPTGWLYGVRVDLWSLEIDWKDPGNRRGSTDILVLQPTVEVGYGWSTPSSGRLEATLGLGAEINIETDGEDVGEGAIALLGVTWIP